MVEISILVIAGALFLFALAAVIYVAYRFLALVVAQDMQILREINFMQRILPKSSGAPSVLNQFQTVNTNPSEGGFEYTSDEELAIAEKIRQIKNDGGYLTEEEEKELEAQLRQGGVTVPY